MEEIRTDNNKQIIIIIKIKVLRNTFSRMNERMMFVFTHSAGMLNTTVKVQGFLGND